MNLIIVGGSASEVSMEELRPFKIQLKRPATNILPVGAGAFGKAYGISYNGAPCIAKCLHNILMGRGMYEAVPGDQTKSLFARFVKECVLHSKLRHPNIVQFIGVEYGNDPDNYDLHLVMERMDTNLESCLEAFPNIAIKLSVLRDVSAGLLYLHSFNPPIIHGDLTTTNILLTPDWRAKIADFGNSVDENILSTAPGALIYMPPEAFVKPLRYDAKLDIFSFGTVSLFMSLQLKPCDYGKREELIRRLSTDQQLECMYQIVTWCCEKDQRKRPSSMDLNTRLQDLCSRNTHILHMVSNTVADRNLDQTQTELEVAKRDQEEELKNPIKQIDELKIKLQLQEVLHEEELEHVRAEMIQAVQARKKIAEEFEAYKKANEDQPKAPPKKLRGFEDVQSSKQKELDLLKANLEAMENIVQKQFKSLSIQLAEAQEEIAVKVAQVKQYQKQVEAYKQQLEQCRSSMNLVPSQAPQALPSANVEQPNCSSTSSFEPVNPEHSDPSLRGQAKSACDGDNRLNTPSSVASQNAASNCVPEGDSKEDDSDDDLPPPMFHKPYQPMYHPAVAHGMQTEYIPLTAACSRMAQTNSSIPPSAPNPEQIVEHDYRGFEDTDSIVPLDPNLKCPTCGKAFKKGRIQKYKRHVQMCGM